LCIRGDSLKFRYTLWIKNKGLEVKFWFSAGVVVYFKRNEKREYLLLHYESGHWDFPKGKIEEGETKQQAALRELKEETGLLATIHPGFEYTFEYFFKDKSGEFAKKKVYFFVGRSKAKRVDLSYEHIGYEWLAFDEACEKLTYKNAKQLLQKADTFLSKAAL